MFASPGSTGCCSLLVMQAILDFACEGKLDRELFPDSIRLSRSFRSISPLPTRDKDAKLSLYSRANREANECLLARLGMRPPVWTRCVFLFHAVMGIESTRAGGADLVVFVLVWIARHRNLCHFLLMRDRWRIGLSLKAAPQMHLSTRLSFQRRTRTRSNWVATMLRYSSVVQELAF